VDTLNGIYNKEDLNEILIEKYKEAIKEIVEKNSYYPVPVRFEQEYINSLLKKIIDKSNR